MRGVAAVVELKDLDARYEHLDAVDRVLGAVVLERVDGVMENSTASLAELEDEDVARVGRVGEAHASLAVRELVDESWNLVPEVKQASA